MAAVSEQPLVSVLMSVYNGEKWLQKAINSILAQTYSNWQVVITDDGSTDKTKNILQQYDSDSRFKIIYRFPNQGYVKAFNNALADCTGKYIARFDSDDMNLPERFEKQVALLEQHPDVSMVAAFINFIDEADTITGVWNDDRNTGTSKAIKSLLPYKNCIAHPCVMIRSDVLKKYRYNELQTNSEDWDLWLQLCADNLVIEKINEPLLLYRVHTTSVTGQSLKIKRSAFRKNHFTYRQYFKRVLQQRKFNLFNTRVFAAFCINYVKMLLSDFKHSVSHYKRS